VPHMLPHYVIFRKDLSDRDLDEKRKWV